MNNSLRPDGIGPFTPSTQQARDSALLRATTELFVQELAHQRDDIHRFEELATHLLPKVPVAERAFVAERLAPRLDAPVAVLRMLARDRIEVARAVLTRSPVLGPQDLLPVIAATGPDHHKLIAARPGLSSEVMKALRISGGRDLTGVLDEIEAALRPAPKTIAPAPTATRASATAPKATSSAARAIPAATTPAAPAKPKTDWFAHREAIALKGNRFDPWNFLGLDRPARLRLMAELATRPPVRRYAGSSDRLDRAFRSILGAAQIVGFARTGQRRALTEAIAEGLGLEPTFVTTCLDDATGEPLAVILKALGLDNVQAQQVLLLATKTLGRDVTVFYKACDIFAAMEPVVAETLIESWREGSHPSPSRHEPLFAENAERRRTGIPEPSRERITPATQRPERLAGS